MCASALASGVNVVGPWAPVHQGSRALELYLARLAALPSLAAYEKKLGYAPIRSFRYLLQDSPRGFFLDDKFVDGLDYLGRMGYAFDMTLDTTHADTRGPLVLDDAVEAISKVRELQKDRGYETKFILGEVPSSLSLSPSRNLPSLLVPDLRPRCEPNASCCTDRSLCEARLDGRCDGATVGVPDGLHLVAVRARAPPERVPQAVGAA